MPSLSVFQVLGHCAGSTGGTVRKGAGQASADAETHTDSLAFQGSMRIKEAGGILAQEIQGSGHHGPDYTGVASVRAGKGQKVSGQAPTLHRLI